MKVGDHGCSQFTGMHSIGSEVALVCGVFVTIWPIERQMRQRNRDVVFGSSLDNVIVQSLEERPKVVINAPFFETPILIGHGTDDRLGTAKRE
jgi:hypothetical protein